MRSPAGRDGAGLGVETATGVGAGAAGRAVCAGGTICGFAAGGGAGGFAGSAAFGAGAIAGAVGFAAPGPSGSITPTTVLNWTGLPSPNFVFVIPPAGRGGNFPAPFSLGKLKPRVIG